LEALPVVAQHVLSLIDEGTASVAKLAGVLGTDQALASAVLRAVNSAEAMPAQPIGSLRQALARIGQTTLRELVLRACAMPMLNRGLPPYALPRRVAWRHAATSAVAARSLAHMTHTPCAEEAGMAGLLHDVGKAVLTSAMPEAAAEAVSVARSRRLPVWQAEEQVLGFSHAAVGAGLLQSWGLPDSVVAAVLYHHQPSATPNRLATVVYLADAAAHTVGAVGGGGACPQPEWDMPAAEALGATPQQIEGFLTTLQCVEESGL
jgi:putative nucleotidyltransferase with HDIG domain